MFPQAKNTPSLSRGTAEDFLVYPFAVTALGPTPKKCCRRRTWFFGRSPPSTIGIRFFCPGLARSHARSAQDAASRRQRRFPCLSDVFDQKVGAEALAAVDSVDDLSAHWPECLPTACQDRDLSERRYRVAAPPKATRRNKEHRSNLSTSRCSGSSRSFVPVHQFKRCSLGRRDAQANHRLHRPAVELCDMSDSRRTRSPARADALSQRSARQAYVRFMVSKAC